MRRLILLSGILFLLAGCGTGEEAQREAREPAVDSMAMAMEQFDPTVFDTITWESQEKALDRGRVVYNVSCSRCHGNAGRGDAGFVMQGDTLEPPSLLQEDWKFGEDKDALLKQIYTGTEGAMPHWGLVGLQYRDVDAVATYIYEVIRLGVGQ